MPSKLLNRNLKPLKKHWAHKGGDYGWISLCLRVRKRIYHLNDNSVVIEHPDYPGKTRFQFYTRSGQSIRKPADKTAMKQAVERHKKRWRLA